MNKLETGLKALGKSINRNSPTLLMGLGISGFVGTIVMAIEATPKAMSSLEGEAYARVKEYADWREVLEPKEIVEIALPYYLPTILGAAMSTGMIIMGNKIHLRRTAALASLYALAEDTLRTYQGKVTSMLGEKKTLELSGDIAEEKMANTTMDMIHNPGGGAELCFEMFTGRYFWSEANYIHAAMNKLNEELLSEDFKSLNEFYYELGLPSVEIGDTVGWKLDDGLIDLILGSRLSPDGRPCITVDMVNRPKHFVYGSV